MKEQQLQNKQEMLDAQLGAERDFLKKWDATRKQFDSSVSRIKAMKDQEGAGGASAVHPKQMVYELLDELTGVSKKPSTVDFRGAFFKRDSK